MDRWKAKELKSMELGGNKLAAAYYEKNGMMQADGTPNHKAPQLSKYKQDLAKKAEMEILANANIQVSNTFQQTESSKPISKPLEPSNPGTVVKQMSSLTFATATDDDIFGSLSKPIVKSDDRKQEQNNGSL